MTTLSLVMDYDNFEQMVLGANLTVVKSKEMGELIGSLNPKSMISFIFDNTFK